MYMLESWKKNKSSSHKKKTFPFLGSQSDPTCPLNCFQKFKLSKGVSWVFFFFFGGSFTNRDTFPLGVKTVAYNLSHWFSCQNLALVQLMKYLHCVSHSRSIHCSRIIFPPQRQGRKIWPAPVFDRSDPSIPGMYRMAPWPEPDPRAYAPEHLLSPPHMQEEQRLPALPGGYLIDGRVLGCELGDLLQPHAQWTTEQFYGKTASMVMCQGQHLYHSLNQH